MPIRSLAPAVLLTLSPGLAAQVDAAAGKLDQIRALHAEFTKARDAAQQEQRDLADKLRAAERGSDEQKKLQAAMAEVRGRVMASHKAFRAAFTASDWTRFDTAADQALLEDGLPETIGDLANPQRAVAAGEFYLAHFGAGRAAGNIRGNGLPMALLACGKPKEATARLEKEAAAVEGADRARLLVALGDIAAAGGDVTGAMARYEAAGPLADERAKSYVTLRTELIGKFAPEIDSRNWIGGEAKALSAHKGSIVLVDFWATWCSPCRAVMPALNELYHKHHAAGLDVIGLTRFYAHGYMPANQEQMAGGGQSVQGLTEATFAEHVTAFKKNAGIDYPFAIGTEQDFKNYRVSGIPTLAVVDRSGKVALVTVGSGSEGLLLYAVGNLLARK